MIVFNGSGRSPAEYIPDCAFGCTHKCFMHLKVALSIALIVVKRIVFK